MMRVIIVTSRACRGGGGGEGADGDARGACALQAMTQWVMPALYPGTHLHGKDSKLCWIAPDH
jgi:hypothetical protein